MSFSTSPTATPETERESGRHPVNVAHLVMGVALLGLFAIWALIISDVVEGDHVSWLLPTPWVLAGGAGLIALAVNRKRGRENRRVGWIAPVDSAADHAEEPTDTEPNPEETR